MPSRTSWQLNDYEYDTLLFGFAQTEIYVRVVMDFKNTAKKLQDWIFYNLIILLRKCWPGQKGSNLRPTVVGA